MEKQVKVAVLAVQGAFIEHIHKLEALGVSCVQLRRKSDLKQQFDGIVLPGGESTVQGKLLRELDMFDDISERIKGGLPVLATCAGLILLSEEIEGNDTPYFGTLPVTVKRNAYGRQLGSFFMEGEFAGIGKVPMEFIRAPYIVEVSDGVEVLAKENEHIVAVRYENQLAMAFHPELCDDDRIHKEFLGMIG